MNAAVSRDTAETMLALGRSNDDLTFCDCYFNNLVVFNSVQHTSNFSGELPHSYQAADFLDVENDDGKILAKIDGSGRIYASNLSGNNTGDQTDATLTFSDVTTNNSSSSKHGFSPKSPADATKFLNGAATPAYAQVKDSDLSTSDVTTNNVVSTKHGFAPKSPADATQFLNGAATPAYAAVKDSDLSTSDVTTNNASTTKHGFLKKLDNTATHYMDGTGAWSTPAGSDNFSNSYIHLQDQESSGTNGGTATSGSWQTRTLNTKVTDDIGITLSSNTFALPAGTYYISASAPAAQVSDHQARLYNQTDSSVTIYGTPEIAGGTAGIQSRSFIEGRFVLSGTKTMRIDHQVGVTKATSGYGLATGFGTGNSEIYTDVQIWQIA